VSFQKTKELIENGTTGKIHQIVAQIHYNPGQEDTTIQEPPASLDWDAWCGPAPKLPYRPSIAHKAWRLEKEYGNGHLVDWGIHHIDIIRTIMGMEIPDSFQANGSLDILKGRITTPDTLNVTMNFKECPVLWQHRLWGTGDLNTQFNNGIFFYGEKATLFASNDGLVLQPAGRNQQQQIMDVPTPDVQEKHVSDFIQAVKANDKRLLSCTTEDAWKSTTTVQLAMISYYSGSGVKWDNTRKTIVENETAAKQLARKYRDGYIRPV
jgi:predicted dehydrogenase